MQCLYWLVHSDIPHKTKYGSLVDGVQFMGCDYFKSLNHAENAKYKIQRIIGEFLQVMATQMENSSFDLLMIDETTDIGSFK